MIRNLPPISNPLHKHSSDQQVTTNQTKGGLEKIRETRSDCLHLTYSSHVFRLAWTNMFGPAALQVCGKWHQTNRCFGMKWIKYSGQLCFFHTYLSKFNNYRYAYYAQLLFLITLTPKTILFSSPETIFFFECESVECIDLVWSIQFDLIILCSHCYILAYYKASHNTVIVKWVA